jgi:multidrug efflux pump subunit AcrB
MILAWEECEVIELPECTTADDLLSNEQEKQAIALYRHTKELSKLRYESELRREDSLIQQSSHMQAAFSFMTAAVFMALPIMIEHKGNLSLNFFFVAISSIVFFLLISLVTASLAQRRVKKEAMMNVNDIEKFVSDNWTEALTESQQLKQWVNVIGKIQGSLSDVNNKRVTQIRLSMLSFFISIGLIVFWYIVAVCKML